MQLGNFYKADREFACNLMLTYCGMRFWCVQYFCT